MIKSHKGAHKLGQEYMNGDPAPTWENRLKNQMGYAGMSDLAKKVHGKGSKIGEQDPRQVLSDLGVKSTTENYEPEMVEDKFESRGKPII